MPERIRRNISHRLRRFLVLSISLRELLAQAVRLGALHAAVRLQGSRRRHGEAVPAPSALRPAGGRRQFVVPGRRAVSKRVSRSARAVSAARRRAHFRVRHASPSSAIPDVGAFLQRTRSVSGRAAARFSLRRRDPQSRVPFARILRLPAQPRRRSRLQRLDSHARNRTSQMHLRDAYTADFTRGPRAAPARPALRGSRREVHARTRTCRTPIRRPATRCGCLIAHARERHQPSYIFVNNRLEGNAPETIEAITE